MKKILGLIAVISLATLTACGQANSAATLGDITISQAKLQTTVDTLLKEREGKITGELLVKALQKVINSADAEYPNLQSEYESRQA
mgnify:CR=1 FL=1